MRIILVLASFAWVAGCYGRARSTVDASTDAGFGATCTHADTGPAPNDEPLWGVADLHTHPAVHLGFNGTPAGAEGWVWGAPGLIPSRTGVIPDAPACDSEAHSFSSTDQVTRAVRSLIGNLLGDLAHYPHGPAGAYAAGTGRLDYETWPNARDLFHQQMHIEAIHRAWEGGLRLMFASVTDNEVITLAFSSPAFPGDVVLHREDELRMAEEQLLYIEDMARSNADWMEIVTSPEQARSAIRDGRLALVLALEMDALTEDDVDYLYQAHGVRSIVPIHVADNDIGGTAAYNPFFNSASAILSRHFGGEGRRYISVVGDPAVTFRYDWLQTITLGAANYEPQAISYDLMRSLGLEPFPTCAPVGNGIDLGLGHVNALGVADARRIDHLMSLGMLVDVAHMSTRSVNDTLDIADAFLPHDRPRDSGVDDGGVGDGPFYRPYPVIDTHTGVAFDGERRGDERGITFDQARRILRSGGIVGLGTGGIPSQMVSEPAPPGPQPRPPILSHRPPRRIGRWLGQPLMQFAVGSSTQRVVSEETSETTTHTITGSDLSSLTVDSTLTIGPTFVPEMTVRFCPDEDTRIPAVVVRNAMNCTAEVCTILDGSLPAGLEARRVDSIAVTLRETGACRTAGSGDDAWTIRRMFLDRDPDDTELGPAASIGLNHDHNGATVYTGACDDTDPGALAPFGHDLPRRLFRISLRSGALGLRGATPLYTGTNVTVQLTSGGALVGPLVSVNGHATWGEGVRIDQYFSATGVVGDDLGVEVGFSPPAGDRPNPWRLDEIVLDEIYDPVDGWVEYYAALAEALSRSCPELCDWDRCEEACERVHFSLGTDLDGFAPQFPISGHHVHYPLEYTAAGRQVCIAAPLFFGSTPMFFEDGLGEDGMPTHRGRGLASYGMFPELFSLVGQRAAVTSTAVPPANGVLDSMFRSAEDLVQVWEDAVRVSRARR